MKKNILLGLFAFSLIASMIQPYVTGASLINGSYPQSATHEFVTVYFDKPTIRATAVGQEFTATVYVENVTNLNAWQFGMIWNSTMVECLYVTINYSWFGPEGETLKTGGTINNVEGYMSALSVVFTTLKGVNGTGPLAHATFRAKATGTTDIHLSEVKLKDNTPATIPANIIDVYTVILDGIAYPIVTVSNLTGLRQLYRFSGHAFNYTAREISFNVTGPDEAFIFCNVTIPKNLLNGGAEPWEVYLDGNPLTYIEVENATHTSLYFTLTLSTHRIQIIKPPPDTTPPVADAGPDQTVNEDTVVTFDGSGSTDNVGIVSYTWTFTDVTPKTLTGVNPNYTFTNPGVYTVTLNVTDAAGNWDTDTVTITVRDVTPPVADAGPDQSVLPGTTVIFNGSGSTDNVGIVNYTWTFTDVTPQSLTGVNPNYTFDNTGDFEITLNVTDAASNWDTDNMWVHVWPDVTPPVADAGPNQSVVQGTLVTFDGSGSTDNVGIVSYVWTFTDVTPKTLTDVQPQYRFNNTGDFEVTLNVSDAAGNWDTDTMWVNVSADITSPIANAGPDQTVNEDTLVTFNGSASWDDGLIVNYTWTFTDVTPQTLTGIYPTYTFDNPGVYIVTLNVTDLAGNWDTDTVTITVRDVTPPVADAGPDQTVDEDTLVTFNGSGSTDNVDIVSYTWTFIDVTPQTLTGISPNHTFATPGIYIVTLNVSDAAGNWDTDTVVITVLDVTSPTADAGPNQTVFQGMTVPFNGSGSTDNVGIVSYVWTFTDVTPQTLTGVNPNYTFSNVGNFTVTLNVTDAAGNWAVDTMWVYVSEDAIEPSIGDPSHDPLEPEEWVNVTVSVSVTDGESGVKNVTLSYTINNGTSWTDLPMNYNATTGLYEAIILGQQYCTWVKYKIIAYDKAGNQAINDKAGQLYVYHVIPEFPTWAPMLLMLFAIVIIMTVLKRRTRSHKMLEFSVADNVAS